MNNPYKKQRIEIIAFDADDTLWNNQYLYDMTQDRFADILSPYHDRDWIIERLFQTEMRNLEYFGYGIKSFTLSMIETAIELTEGRITGGEIQNILDYCHQMLRAPIELLPGVRKVISTLAPEYDLMVITKGDLLDQESKIARSGLGDLFSAVEVVSSKTVEVYADLLQRHEISVDRFLMVGNSLRSDVLPVVALGGRAVHIQAESTWSHEEVSAEEIDNPGYFELEAITDLPDLLRSF